MSKIKVIVVLFGTLFINGCKVQEVKDSSTIEPTLETFYSFKGVGHEPEWFILIGDSQIVFSHINQPKKETFKKLRKIPIMDVAGISYSAFDESENKIQVEIFKQDCRDIMADKTWPVKVDVSVETGSAASDREELQFSGCGTFQDERLAGTWLLKSLNGKKIKVKEEESNLPQVVFYNKENSISANMGCNRMGGSYDLWNNTIYFNENFMITLMICKGKMALEKEFSEFVIGKSLKYAFVGEELIFSDFENKVIMTLRKD